MAISPLAGKPAPKELLIDVGRIEDRYFLNVTGFGFDIAVIEQSARLEGRHMSMMLVSK